MPKSWYHPRKPRPISLSRPCCNTRSWSVTVACAIMSARKRTKNARFCRHALLFNNSSAYRNLRSRSLFPYLAWLELKSSSLEDSHGNVACSNFADRRLSRRPLDTRFRMLACSARETKENATCHGMGGKKHYQVELLGSPIDYTSRHVAVDEKISVPTRSAQAAKILHEAFCRRYASFHGRKTNPHPPCVSLGNGVSRCKATHNTKKRSVRSHGNMNKANHGVSQRAFGGRQTTVDSSR